jgi:hypothetical protein
MSWSFEFVAEDKQKAIAKVEAEGAKEHGMPPDITAALVTAIGRTDTALYQRQVGAVFGLHVTANGHLDGAGGSATFALRVLPLLK